MPPQQAVASYALKACERRGIVARFLGEAGEVPSHGNVLRFVPREARHGACLVCSQDELSTSHVEKDIPFFYFVWGRF